MAWKNIARRERQIEYREKKKGGVRKAPATAIEVRSEITSHEPCGKIQSHRSGLI